MRFRVMLTLLIVAGYGLRTATAQDGSAEARPMHPRLTEYVAARIAEFDQIPAERRAQLAELAEAIRARQQAGGPVSLTFICTHNSRRSHMAQLWTAAAAAHYGVPGIRTYSGGTEATAFNPRAVAALQRAGFELRSATAGENPNYAVRLGPRGEELTCFSKVYDAPPNPAADFIAVLVCGQADESCPRVGGAVARIAIRYDDPKAADGTPQEAERYDERCRQIAREMLYALARVRAADTRP